MSNADIVKPFTGRHMALIFIAFFGVVLCVNIVMSVIAFKSWTGLVVENSYVASQHFNEETAKLNQSVAMGFTHQLHYGAGKLDLTIRNSQGQPVSAGQVDLAIGRPVDNGEDMVLHLQRVAEGKFEVSTKLGTGVWAGRITAKIDGQKEWTQPFRLIVTGE